ncbi:MAG: hypothetical protein PIR53_16855 [Nocardioides alkalitolerans]|jgi:hypothetical protein
MHNAAQDRRSTPAMTWVKVTDIKGRTRMEARWTSASPAVARPAAA